MSWQTAILLQVIVSSGMTVFTRHLTLSVRRVFFGVGLVSYITIALAGVIFSIVRTHAVPTVADSHAWFFLAVEGLCIPAAWLVQYQLIKHIGAANAVIVSTLNVVFAAGLGIVLLDESVSWMFAVGAVLILVSMLVSVRIRPDMQHKTTLGLSLKLVLAISGAVLFAIGMFAEKKAIGMIGVWNYTAVGWGLQAVGALVLFGLFGLRELPHMNQMAISKGVALGAITSVAGCLYVYALSKGELSRTIIATSGKVAITLVLAAIILRERNELNWRLLAFALSIAGLVLVV